jgi:hypothetical protein
MYPAAATDDDDHYSDCVFQAAEWLVDLYTVKSWYITSVCSPQFIVVKYEFCSQIFMST